MTKKFNDKQNNNVNINRLQAQLQTATNTLVKAQEAVGALALQEKREEAFLQRLYEVGDALCSECLHLQWKFCDEGAEPVDYKQELERARSYVEAAYHDVGEMECAMRFLNYPLDEYSHCQKVDKKWSEKDREEQVNSSKKQVTHVTVDLYQFDHSLVDIPTTCKLVEQLEAEKKRSNVLYDALIQMAKQCSFVKGELMELYDYLGDEDMLDNTVNTHLDCVDDVLADVIRDVNGIQNKN